MIAAVPGGHLFLGGEIEGGSLKVRLMEKLLEDADLPPGHLVADISAGHGAVALARVARRLGLRCRVYVPDSAPPQALEAMREAHADVRLSPPTPDSMGAALSELRAGHASGELFWTRQNYQPCDAYRALASALPVPVPDHLVAGVGTGGSLRSFGDYYLALNPRLKIHAVFSHNLGGLRPRGLAFDFAGEADIGSCEVLSGKFGTAFSAQTLTCDQLEDKAIPGLLAGDSTLAVVQVMRGLSNALGISIDGRRGQAGLSARRSLPDG